MLPRVLDSLLEKQRSAICFEVIVVDNASTDDTREVVEPYTRRDNVRYVVEEELGLSHARNAGWRNASGQYVAFLDDDGEVSEDWLDGYLDAFTAHPDAAACGGRIIPRYAVAKPAWIADIAEPFCGHYDLGDKVSACEWVPGGNAVWRRDVLETLGGFDTRFGIQRHGILIGGEDNQLIQEAIQRGYKLYYSPKALMFRHISSDRVSIRYLARRWFGQGFLEFRYREVRNLIGRRAACRESIRMFGKSLCETARMMQHALMWRRERALPRLFDLMHYLGRATGAARCAWRGPIGGCPSDC
jgi:glycosyltransferase involved in cell wall biosynthesis